jgi:hypothetical protein
MGCDIHILREKLVNDQWITGETWQEPEDDWCVPATEVGGGRNYKLFYCLARVRGDLDDTSNTFRPRGLPLQPAPESAAYARVWGVDGHSHSYLYLFELEELLASLKQSKIKVIGMKDLEGLQKLNDAIAAGDPNCWELLYPYCAWTNSPKCVYFEVDVPGDFLVGEQLTKIINGLKEIGGDNQRVVFWFEN